MPRSIADIRRANGGLENLTDEDILHATYEDYAPYYKSIDDYAGAIGYSGAGRGLAGARLSAGVDNYQAGLLGLGGAASRAVGADGMADWFDQRRIANEDAAAYAQQRAQDLGAVDDWRDIGGVGAAANYVGGLAAQSLPYLGEAVVGGLAGRGLSFGARGALRGALTEAEAAAAAGRLARNQTLGAVGASYPSSVGDILSNQREAGGEDLGSALVGGVPYAALNALGETGLVARGFRPLTQFEGGALRRGALAAGQTALEEGVGETGQELVNQYFGRMAINPGEGLFNDEANRRYLDSFVGGAALGGLMGGAAGVRGRREFRTVDDGQFDLTTNPNESPNLSIYGNDSVVPLQEQLAQQFGLSRKPQSGYEKQFLEAFNEPSGQRVVDENGIERELSVGEVMQRQAGVPDQAPAQESVAEKQQIAPTKVFDDVDRALMERGVAPNKLRKDLYTELQASGLDPAHDNLAGFWQLMSSGSTGKARTELAKAIAAAKKEATNVSVPSVSDPAVAASSPAGGPVNSGGMATPGPVSAVGERAGGDAVRVGAPSNQAPVVANGAGERAAPVGENTSMLAGSNPATPPVGKAPSPQATPVAQAADPFQVDPAYDEDADRLEIARMTGRGAEVDAIEQEASGQRVDAVDVGTADAEAIIGKHLEGSKTAARDRKILDAWLATARTAGYRSKGKIKEALAKDFGIGATRVEQIANIKKITAAAKALGYTEEQAYEALGIPMPKSSAATAEVADDTSAERKALENAIEDLNARIKTAKAGEKLDLEAQRKELKGVLSGLKDSATEEERGQVAAALTKAGFTTEEGAGFGLDDSRHWQKESSSGNQGAEGFLRFAKQIEDIRAAIAELEQQGLSNVVGELEGLAQKIQDEAAAAAAVIEAAKAPAVPKREVSADLAAVKQKFKDVGRDVAKMEPEELRMLRGEAERFKNTDLMAKIDAQLGVEPIAEEAKTDTEKARGAWDKEAKSYDGAPMFDELSKDQQDRFVGYGPENWNASDVAAELARIQRDSGVDAHETFSDNDGGVIDPQDEEVDRALRGKNIHEALKWAMDNDRNHFERTVLRAVAARIKELERLGVKFSFRMTGEGKRLTGGASGVALTTPASLGQAMRVDIILNGAENGVHSGANYETLVHELIHAATAAQVKFAPNGSAAQELKSLYNEVIKQFNAKVKAGTLSDFEKKLFNQEQNSINDADELLAWGLTNREFQTYLAGINVTPRVSLWGKLVDIVSKALGIPVSAKSALGKLMSISEEMFDESLDPYVSEANSRMQSLGKQENNTGWPDWSLNSDLGKTPVWVDGDYALYEATGTRGGKLFIPGMRAGDMAKTAKVDVGSFTGNAIPAAGLAKMKAAADSLRQQASPMAKVISFGKSTPGTGEVFRRTLDQVPNELRGPVKNLLTAVKDASAKGLDYVIFTNDLINRAVDAGITSAKSFRDLLVQRSEKVRSLEREVERIADQYALVPDRDKTGHRSVNNFLFESTRQGKWGYDHGKLKADPGMATWFNSFDAKTKDFVRAVFAHGDTMLAQKKATVMKYTETEYDARIAAEADPEAKAELEQDKKNSIKRFERLFAIREGMPYAPIKRSGNYVVVAMSSAYMDAKAAKDTKLMEKLEKDEAHYQVSFTDTKWEARRMAERLAADGSYDKDGVYLRERDQHQDALYGGDGVLKSLSKLRTRIENSDDKSSAKVLRLVSDLYLEALAENSSRKSEMRRRGIAGNVDMIASFAKQGRADANFMASVQYGHNIQRALQSMTNEVHGARDDGRASEIRNELVARYVQSLDRPETPWVNRLNRMSSLYYLAFSPAYYMQNLTQPWMMSVPALTGRHGYGEANSALFKAYGQLKDVIGSGKAFKQNFDLSKVPGDVRSAIQELANRGKIDIGIESEMGSFSAEGEGKVAGAVNKIDRGLRLAVQKVETINRLSTAMAAYRLERSKNRTHEQAVEYADRILTETHGDYTGMNAPRAFNTSLGKVSLQFRKFQLIQLSYYAKLVNSIFTDPKERGAALKMLGYSLGHTALFAGVRGLPGFAALAWVASKLLGDDDEPYDLEQDLRNAIGDKDLANLIMRGAPTLAGLDLSGKVGAGNMFSILPFSNADLTTEQGRSQAVGELVLGASGGMVSRMADGLGQALEGDFFRGMEKMLPKGLGDPLKAYREFTGGMTRRNGEIMLSPDEISFAESMMTGLGFSPVQKSVAYEQQQLVRNMDQNFQDRSSKIKGQYIKAARDKDTAAMAEARAAWAKLQETRVKNGYSRQPLSQLLTAPQQQAKREKSTTNGVQFNKQNRRFVESQV
jgi:hypothetical protein